MERARASYGASLLVAVGWFVTVLVALYVGDTSVPRDPRRECPYFGSCVDTADLVPIVAVTLGPPLLLVLAAVTKLVTRLPMSPAAAGTLSALASAVVVLVGLAVVLNLR